METIAFSTKSLDWKTRYSFQPLHYARSGTDLISFSRSGEEAGVHLHDSSDEYNKFYETTYPSKLSVITNNNPSATKIYEAFSFEATKGGWSTKFTTETGEKQEGSADPEQLVEREGKFYSSVPKNELNLSAFTRRVGHTTFGDMDDPQKLKMSGKVFRAPGKYIGFVVPRITPDQMGSDLNVGGYSTASILLMDGIADTSKLGVTLALVDAPSIFEVEIATKDNVFSSQFLELLGNYFTEYDVYSNSLIVNTPYADALATQLSVIRKYILTAIGALSSDGGTAFEEEQQRIELLSGYPLDIVTFVDPKQNGEDMRGEFMKIDIERSGTDYYELFAINVDQHQTKLDHSLGQNN